jgi:hypothetical protein
VVPDKDAREALRFLRELRDEADARAVTKIYSLPAEEADY